MEPIFDEEKIAIKFEGQTHRVDVNTLTSSLIIFSEALKEINKDVGSGKNVDIKIEAVKPGSFEIHTVVAAVNESELLKAIGVIGAVATAIVSVYTGILKLRSWLNNNKEIASIEVNGDITQIKSKTGDVYFCPNTTYNIYNNNQVVNDHISDQFRILEEDPAVEGLTIKSQKDAISISNEEFSSLAARVDVTNKNKRKELKTEQTVYVVKPVLEKSTTRRWEFIWQGNKITANISDTNFLEKVEQGEYRFGTGDTMIVNLQINQILSPIYDAWLNESYQIILVNNHIPRQMPDKTIELFDK